MFNRNHTGIIDIVESSVTFAVMLNLDYHSFKITYLFVE